MDDLDKGMSYIDLDDDSVSLEVGLAVRENCHPAWRWDSEPAERSPQPSSILLWLVHRGGAQLDTSQGVYTVKRGDFLLMPSSGVAYHARHTPEKVFDVTWLFFRVADQQADLGGVSGLPFQTVLVDAPFAERLMKRLLVASPAMRGRWLGVLLDEVRRQHAARIESETGAQMRALGERIQASPGRYLGLNDMLVDYPYSKDHLIRLFRKQHGVTPVEFLICARMDSACGLLSASAFSIKQIAAQLGYADAFCFSRQFKARTGRSPTAFREM